MTLEEIFNGKLTPSKWLALGRYLARVRIRGGVGIRVSSQSVLGTVISAKRTTQQSSETRGRFRLSVSPGAQQLNISEGCVAYAEDTLVTPFFPELNGAEISGGSFWDLTAPNDLGAWAAGTTYRIAITISAEKTAELVVLPEEDPDDDEAIEGESRIVIGTVLLKANEADASKLEADTIVQLWESDVLWPYPGSSSSAGSSGDSSGISSGGGSEGSEKSSNAIVPLATRETRFAALATIESNQVLFEFVMRDLALTGRETRVPIHPDHLAVCEPGTLTLCGAPCAPTPCAIGAEVDGSEIILRTSRLPWNRPQSVTLKLTGIRKGFAPWDMPNRTEGQYTENEQSLRAMYKR